MLAKTQFEEPLCIMCKQPTTFLSLERVEGKSGEQTVAVFQCKICGQLTAESIGKAAA